MSYSLTCYFEMFTQKPSLDFILLPLHHAYCLFLPRNPAPVHNLPQSPCFSFSYRQNLPLYLKLLIKNIVYHGYCSTGVHEMKTQRHFENELSLSSHRGPQSLQTEAPCLSPQEILFFPMFILQLVDFTQARTDTRKRILISDKTTFIFKTC